MHLQKTIETERKNGAQVSGLVLLPTNNKLLSNLRERFTNTKIPESSLEQRTHRD